MYLVSKLKIRTFVFTLKAPLKICIERDSKRKNPYGKIATMVVYNLVSRLDYGTNIGTENKTPEEVTKEILNLLPKQN